MRIALVLMLIAFAFPAHADTIQRHAPQGMYQEIALLNTLSAQCSTDTCRKEARERINDVKGIIYRSERYTTNAQRDLIKKDGYAIADKIDDWAKRYRIKTVK